jgi:beta-glucosidase
MSFGNLLPRPTRAFKYVAMAVSLAVAVPAAVLAHTGPGDPAARAEAQTVPIYLNRAYSPAERAADLVSRMTTAEKAAQMDSSQAPRSRAWAWPPGAGGTSPITA